MATLAYQDDANSVPRLVRKDGKLSCACCDPGSVVCCCWYGAPFPHSNGCEETTLGSGDYRRYPGSTLLRVTGEMRISYFMDVQYWKVSPSGVGLGRWSRTEAPYRLQNTRSMTIMIDIEIVVPAFSSTYSFDDFTSSSVPYTQIDLTMTSPARCLDGDAYQTVKPAAYNGFANLGGYVRYTPDGAKTDADSPMPDCGVLLPDSGTYAYAGSVSVDSSKVGPHGATVSGSSPLVTHRLDIEDADGGAEEPTETGLVGPDAVPMVARYGTGRGQFLFMRHCVQHYLFDLPSITFAVDPSSTITDPSIPAYTRGETSDDEAAWSWLSYDNSFTLPGTWTTGLGGSYSRIVGSLSAPYDEPGQGGDIVSGPVDEWRVTWAQTTMSLNIEPTFVVDAAWQDCTSLLASPPPAPATAPTATPSQVKPGTLRATDPETVNAVRRQLRGCRGCGDPGAEDIA